MASEVDVVAVGSPQEATAAVARMLAVTTATYERRAQLEHALQSRIAIEQAKGIIAERCRLDLEDAFEVIRRAARTNRSVWRPSSITHGRATCDFRPIRTWR